MEKIRVLFVCMGNICRSPTAEGVFQSLIKSEHLGHKIDVDSAGTHAYHMGDAPDLRAQKAAKDRDVDLASLRARKVIVGDYHDFDYLLVMDEDNYQLVMEFCPEEHKHKVKYFLEYAPHLDTLEVPDPYYGGKYGFELVLDMVEDASTGFLNSLKKSGQLI